MMLNKINNFRKPIVLITIISIFGFTGCATVFKGTKGTVSTHSTPPAKVYVNGQYRGETPLKLKLSVKKDYTITFKKDGYQPKTVHISNPVGAGWIALDIVLGLVPVVVDAITGAWHKLDQSSVNAVLREQQ